MKIVINSHNKSNIALNHLLESMKKQKEYNEFNIIIVIGGYYNNPPYIIETDSNITYIYCNHNSIDFTGLIALSELYYNTDEYYFYMHDTCKIGDNFYNKLKKIDLTSINVTTIKINKLYSMNIGIYSQKIINQFKDFLKTKKNINPELVMQFKSINFNEDYIFKNDCNNYVLDNYDGYNCTEPTDYYGTGIMRIVEYYPNIDLYKIKANWGQGNWQLNN
jgi:hypothetical protein